MKELRVIVAGSRGIKDYNYIKKHLDNLFSSNPLFNGKDIIIVSGGAAGVDTLGENYADEKGLQKERYPADWKNLNVKPCKIKYNQYGPYNALAGIVRNGTMQSISNVAVVFWDGLSTGSKDMIQKMQSADKPVFVIVNGELLDN